MSATNNIENSQLIDRYGKLKATEIIYRRGKRSALLHIANSVNNKSFCHYCKEWEQGACTECKGPEYQSDAIWGLITSALNGSDMDERDPLL